MKIVHITKNLPWYLGGVERATHVMAEAASAMGCNVEIIGVGLKKDLKRTLPQIGVETALKSFGSIGPVVIAPGYLTLWNHIKDADIIHIHTPHPLAELALIFWGIIGRVKKSKPLFVPVIHAPLTQIPLMTRIWRRLYPYFFKNSSAIISASEHLLNGRKEFERTPENKIYIPWPSEAPVKARQPEPNSASDSCVRILIVGRLVGYKGHQILLKSLSKLDSDWHLDIVGSGPEERNIRQTITELGLKSKVSMLGTRSDDEKSTLLHSCDMFVAPSITTQEGYGIVIAEAMAHGKPVVASDIPTAMQFLTREGACGAKVKAGSTNELASAIRALIEDKNTRDLAGSNNRKFWEENLTRKSYAKNYKSAIDSLLKDVS